MANSEAEVKVAMRTVVRNLGYIKGIITCKMNIESKLDSNSILINMYMSVVIILMSIMCFIKY